MKTKLNRARLWIFIGLFHLAIVTANAFHLETAALPWVGFPADIYGDLSGSGTAYAFFTPGVYAQMRAVIEILEHGSTKRTELLGQGPNREVNLRLNDVIETFMNEMRDQKKFQRSLAASVAGSYFARDANAEKVGVSIERYTAPSRKEYLAGKKEANWVPLYSAKFIHRVAMEKK